MSQLPSLQSTHGHAALEEATNITVETDASTTHSSVATTLVETNNSVESCTSKEPQCEPSEGRHDETQVPIVRIQLCQLGSHHTHPSAYYWLVWHILFTIPFLSATIYFWAAHNSITTENGECLANIPSCKQRVQKARRLASIFTALLAALLVLVVLFTSILIHDPRPRGPRLQRHNRSRKVVHLCNVVILILASFTGLVVCWTKYNSVVLYDHPCKPTDHLCKARVHTLRDFGIVSTFALLFSLVMLPTSVKRVASASVYETLRALWTLLIIVGLVVLILFTFIFSIVALTKSNFATHSEAYQKVIADVLVVSSTFLMVLMSPVIFLAVFGAFAAVYWILKFLIFLVFQLPVILFRFCFSQAKSTEENGQSDDSGKSEKQDQGDQTAAVDVEKQVVVTCKTDKV